MRREWRGSGWILRAFIIGAAAAGAILAQPALAQAPAAAPPLIDVPPPASTAPAPVQLPPLTPSQAATALAALKAADTEGLSPKDYLPADPDDMAALAEGLVAYAHDLHVGRLLPGEFPEMWSVRPAPYDPTPGLAQALADDKLQAFLDAQRPPYSGYHALKRGLARYREIAARGGWKAIPDGKAMGLGSTDPRVAALRTRLAAEDPEVQLAPAVFDQALEDAVIRAQKRYGIRADGVAGKEMLGVLNQPVGQRILQIIANMERWRWLPQEMPATRVQANSGAAVVTLFRDDKPVLSMRAVSGRPGDETPMLMSQIHSIVINPPWNVPTSIATKELWPKERAHPGYLAANDYVVIDTPDGGKRLQQRAGPKAALGYFKFDFDNPFAVYLHDTPSKGGFDRVSRNASHGCVRLQHAQVLAEALLEGDPTWTPEKIQDQLDSQKTVRVPLKEKVAVFIFYWTAFAGPDGMMNFRPDPYSWDHLLLQKVGVLAPSAGVTKAK
jgi:murein L,D-transpeptidase YcbB/YkuD